MKVKLSLRVRPDCEVAGWVYNEILLLEKKNDELIEENKKLADLLYSHLIEQYCKS